MKEKDDESDDISIKDMNILLNEEQNQNEKEKELIKENDINYLDILKKIKLCLEELKLKEKVNRNSNISNNSVLRKSRMENSNIIIEMLDQLIKLFKAKNANELNLNDLSNILKEIQLEFYSNIEILSKINSICGLIINNLKDNEQLKLFLEIIIESLNYNDYNNKSNLLIISLKYLNDILRKNNLNLIELIYDITLPKIYNILNLSKASDSLAKIFCYKIITLFSRNNVFSFDLVSKGLLVNIKQEIEEIKNNKNNIEKNINIQNNSIDNIDNENNIFEINTNSNENNKNKEIEKDYNEYNTNDKDITRQIYIILKNLIEVKTSLEKISEELMEILLSEFLDDDYVNDQNTDLKIDFFESLITKEPKCIESFVKYDGFKCILKLLKMNELNKKIILRLFNILNKILIYDKSYGEIVFNLNFYDYIKEIMEKLGNNEKEIDFKGKSILFLINYGKKKLESIDEYDLNKFDLNKISYPKSDAINFLNSGKIVNIVNNLGEIKTKYLYFSQDLLKVFAKKINSTLPPKQKYIINTMNINSVVKGHGTDVFQKSKTFYRKIPDANKCFSIIAFNHYEGKKSINVICEKESEVDKWVNYIKEIIIYFQGNQRITRNIIYNS